MTHRLNRFPGIVLAAVFAMGGVGAVSAEGAVRGGFVSGDHGRAASKQWAYSADSGTRVAGSRRVYQGDYGGWGWSRKQTAADGQGNAYRRNTQAYRGPEGGGGYKTVERGHSADGSAYKHKKREINGAEGGRYLSESDVRRDANGEVTGSRSVKAEGAAGKTYESSISQQEGQWVREASCADAAGNSVDCR
ncbi:MAG: hypothetical protein AB2551_17800 [Candidatus Thiodiazotropha sp.]